MSGFISYEMVEDPFTAFQLATVKRKRAGIFEYQKLAFSLMIAVSLSVTLLPQ